MEGELFKQREELMNVFIEYFTNEKNKVVLFNGEWGSGKSFFIDKFVEKIKEKSVIPIKFDCWEHQGDDDINNIFLEAVYLQLTDKAYNGTKLENIKSYIKENELDIVKGIGKFLLNFCLIMML